MSINLREQQKIDLGPAKKFLRLEIKQLPDGTITLGQQDNINTILQPSAWEMPIQPLHHCVIGLG